jgi:hypothetical protein
MTRCLFSILNFSFFCWLRRGLYNFPNVHTLAIAFSTMSGVVIEDLLPGSHRDSTWPAQDCNKQGYHLGTPTSPQEGRASHLPLESMFPCLVALDRILIKSQDDLLSQETPRHEVLHKPLGGSKLTMVWKRRMKIPSNWGCLDAYSVTSGREAVRRRSRRSAPIDVPSRARNISISLAVGGNFLGESNGGSRFSNEEVGNFERRPCDDVGLRIPTLQ